MPEHLLGYKIPTKYKEAMRQLISLPKLVYSSLWGIIRLSRYSTDEIGSLQMKLKCRPLRQNCGRKYHRNGLID
jgi:hypothetical protein